MVALFERIVRKIADAAPIENRLENTVSGLVASVLENTANKLARFEAHDDAKDHAAKDAV